MLPDTEIEEELSTAYVKAVCSHAGFIWQDYPRDHGIDGAIQDTASFNGMSRANGYNIEVQVKATTNYTEENGEIVYQLENKTYNDLAEKNVGTERILVLLCLPKLKKEWMTQDVDSLIIKKCAYWHYLKGETKKDKLKSKSTIKIPKGKVFSGDIIEKMMNKIKGGQDLHGI